MSSIRVVSESKDSFYVHLLSNAQPELFKNKANHFQCQLETLLHFPTDEEWVVGVKEFHYVNNVNTITKALNIEVGGLFPLGGFNQTSSMKFPHYFTECGTILKLFHPLQAILETSTPSLPNIVNALNTFLRQERLLHALRLYMECGAGKQCFQKNPVAPWTDRWFKLKVHNATAQTDKLYSGARYALFLSYPLAVILNANTQCILSRPFNATKPKHRWGKESWLGSESHFKEYTLINNTRIRRKVTNTFTSKATTAAPNLATKIQAIQSHLDTATAARSSDYWMTFMPRHRTHIQNFTFSKRNLTYVDLFRQLEDMGLGRLYIDPDQTFLEFTMHDRLNDARNMHFAVELPSALFWKNPRVRVNRWELKDIQNGKKKLVRNFNVLMGGGRDYKAVHSSLKFNGNMGITTFKLEKALEEFSEENQANKLSELINLMDNEVKRISYLMGRSTLNLMHGMNVYKINRTFVLTSNMTLRLAINELLRKTIASTELAKVINTDARHIYTPHDFGIYDVKVPFRRDSDKSFPITIYTRQLNEGKYNIRDEEEALFQAMYAKHYNITTQPGFYTPKSFIHSLQQTFVRNNTPCSIALVNQDMDDNEQGFLQITTGDYMYLQFDSLSKELFQLENEFLPPNSVFISKQPFDLIPETHTVLIYCNIAGESIVGGQREKVLSIAPITYNKYQWGKWVGQVFASTDYYPVAMKSVQIIEIQFRGDTGDFIPITQGRSYVKLHFQRQKRSSDDAK